MEQKDTPAFDAAVLSALKERPVQKHTPGPWRWEVNAESKRVKLMSDAPMRPIVMGFDRWGMNRAAPCFRNAEVDIMQRVEKWLPHGLDERKYLDLPIANPDARLIATAPDLLKLVERAERLLTGGGVFFTDEDACARSNDLLYDIMIANAKVAGEVT